MAKAKLYSSPLPLRAISDQRLSGLDLRTLACVAAHDRMSLARGDGQGCWASHETLSRRIGCNYINLGKSIKKLGDLGYLVREKPTFGDRRGHVYRIPAELYSHAESLSFGKPSPVPEAPEKAPEPAPDDTVNGPVVGDLTNDPAEIVCHGVAENLSETATSLEQYISLSDGRYSAEAEEGYSSEEARLKSRHSPLSIDPSKTFSSSTGSAAPGALQRANDDDVGATLARLERVLKSQPEALDLSAWAGWLSRIGEDLAGEPEGHRAQRMIDDVLNVMSDAEYAAWGRGTVDADPALDELRLSNATSTIRAQVSDYCAQINKAGRDALAKRCGITPAELRSFAEGRLDLPIGKQTALRTATRMAA